MRIGIWGARADGRGIATQTLEVARHVRPERIMGIDMGELTPYPSDWSIYDGLPLTVEPLKRLDDDVVRAWCRGLDVAYAVETFLDAQRPSRLPFPDVAREQGCATVVHVNPELCVWATDRLLSKPDFLACPTTWRMDTIPRARILPMPVALDRLNPRERLRAGVFLHLAGHRAMADRNGSDLVRVSLQFVQGSCRFVVRSQSEMRPWTHRGRRMILEQYGAHRSYWEPYDEADVLVAPRHYGGLSLPLWEAMGAGLAVICLDRAPESSILPTQSLLASSPYRTMRTLGGEIDLVTGLHEDLAARMDEFIASPGLVGELSRHSLEWGRRNSWDALLGCFLDGLASARP